MELGTFPSLDIYLSHDSDASKFALDKVKLIGRLLKQEGVQLVSDIDSSILVVAVITKDYLKKVEADEGNCSNEFNYAVQTRKLQIPVVIDFEEIDPKGWQNGFVKVALEGNSPLDLSSEGDRLEEDVRNLATDIKNRVKLFLAEEGTEQPEQFDFSHLTAERDFVTLVRALSSQEGGIQTKAALALATLADDGANQAAIAVAAGIAPLVDTLFTGTVVGRTYATAALANLACNEANRVTIVEAGAIFPVVKLLQKGKPHAKTQAAAALRNLAVNEDNKVAIAEGGAIPPLVALLIDGETDEAKTNAAGALKNLAGNGQNKVTIYENSGIYPLVQLLIHGTDEGKAQAAGALGSLACNADLQVIIAGHEAIGPLVKLLKEGTEEGKIRAAGALGNLASNAANKITIANTGAIGSLIQLLSNASEEGKVQAAGAIRNLAVNSSIQMRLAEEGAITSLADYLKVASEEGKVQAAWALYNVDCHEDLTERVEKETGYTREQLHDIKKTCKRVSFISSGEVSDLDNRPSAEFFKSIYTGPSRNRSNDEKFSQ